MNAPSKQVLTNSNSHKKNLGKHTLTERLLSIHSTTTSYAGAFYHYTSPEGLLGILKNRNIFFTDAQFLNDSRERLQINDELHYFWSINKKQYDKDFYNMLWNIKVDFYEDDDFSYIENHDEMKICRYFVLSASFEPDSLSMWKYYAKNETYNGYCLGLFTPALSDEWIDRDTGVAIEESAVLYSSEEKQECIFRAVGKLYDCWHKYKRSKKLDQKIMSDFKSWVSCVSIFFKDTCFSDEREYRFVAIVPKDKLSTLSYDYSGEKTKMYDFKSKNGVVIPYIKMPFNYWNADNCWAIESIRIGPSIYSDQMQHGINQLIQSLDYKLENCSIEKSKIPLRY